MASSSSSSPPPPTASVAVPVSLQALEARMMQLPANVDELISVLDLIGAAQPGGPINFGSGTPLPDPRRLWFYERFFHTLKRTFSGESGADAVERANDAAESSKSMLIAYHMASDAPRLYSSMMRMYSGLEVLTATYKERGDREISSKFQGIRSRMLPTLENYARVHQAEIAAWRV